MCATSWNPPHHPPRARFTASRRGTRTYFFCILLHSRRRGRLVPLRRPRHGGGGERSPTTSPSSRPSFLVVRAHLGLASPLRIAAARIAASASLCHHWCNVGGDFLLLSPSLIFAHPLYPPVPTHTNTTPHNIKPPKIIHHTKSHNSGHTHGHIAEVGDQILKGVLL